MTTPSPKSPVELRHRIQEPAPILIVKIQCCGPMTAIHHVIPGPGHIDSQWSCHTARTQQRDLPFVNYLDTTPLPFHLDTTPLPFHVGLLVSASESAGVRSFVKVKNAAGNRLQGLRTASPIAMALPYGPHATTRPPICQLFRFDPIAFHFTLSKGKLVWDDEQLVIR
ncbi:MAG TPA: hypothetical protein PLK78_09840, partial [Verrucomicrobiota bacterium]|nr:hypothetical protein [Verrucomicrobiota bacterium]